MDWMTKAGVSPPPKRVNVNSIKIIYNWWQRSNWKWNTKRNQYIFALHRMCVSFFCIDLSIKTKNSWYSSLYASIYTYFIQILSSVDRLNEKPEKSKKKIETNNIFRNFIDLFNAIWTQSTKFAYRSTRQHLSRALKSQMR